MPVKSGRKRKKCFAKCAYGPCFFHPRHRSVPSPKYEKEKAPMKGALSFGLPERIRTADLQSRSLTRYPAVPRVENIGMQGNCTLPIIAWFRANCKGFSEKTWFFFGGERDTWDLLLKNTTFLSKKVLTFYRICAIMHTDNCHKIYDEFQVPVIIMAGMKIDRLSTTLSMGKRSWFFSNLGMTLTFDSFWNERKVWIPTWESILEQMDFAARQA